MNAKKASKVDKVRWDINLLLEGRRRAWVDAWTPKWHRGRGPYVSIGLYFFAIYRGY